jgi:radical SAM protein with 4Fe4S-binding SPASM domain
MENRSSCEILQLHQLPLWERAKVKRTPLSFNLEITARCNNNCRHCYINLPADDMKARTGELTLKEILEISGQAVEMGALWCLITGGEPLLRPDFPEVFLGLKRLGLLIQVFTNGTLIREEHIRLFRRYPPRDIEVTVYGITRATYETVTRQPGSFDAFQRGLKRLLDNAAPVRLKAMALRSNLHELAAIADFCRRHTKDYYRFDPLLHLRHDRDPQRNEEIRAERLTPQEIADLEQRDPERFQVMQKHCHDLTQAQPHPDRGARLFGCSAGMNSFTVGCHGEFRLCDSLVAEGTTCDLRLGGLQAAWSGLVSQVHGLQSRDSGPQRTCRACPIINLCLSCPSHNYLETGEMEGDTPYFCEVAHARAKKLVESMRQSGAQKVEGNETRSRTFSNH